LVGFDADSLFDFMFQEMNTPTAMAPLESHSGGFSSFKGLVGFDTDSLFDFMFQEMNTPTTMAVRQHS
jgi:hypothetical protein